MKTLLRSLALFSIFILSAPNSTHAAAQNSKSTTGDKINAVRDEINDGVNMFAERGENFVEELEKLESPEALLEYLQNIEAIANNPHLERISAAFAFAKETAEQVGGFIDDVEQMFPEGFFDEIRDTVTEWRDYMIMQPGLQKVANSLLHSVNQLEGALDTFQEFIDVLPDGEWTEETKEKLDELLVDIQGVIATVTATLTPLAQVPILAPIVAPVIAALSAANALVAGARKLVPLGARATNAIRSLTQVTFSLLRFAVEGAKNVLEFITDTNREEIEVTVDEVIEEVGEEPISVEAEGVRVEVQPEEVFAEPASGGGGGRSEGIKVTETA